MSWFDAVKKTVSNGVHAVEHTAQKAVQTVNKVEHKVVDAGVSTFEHATKDGLKLAYDAADKFLPKGTTALALKGVEGAVDVLAKPVELIAGKNSKIGQLANDLSQVDLGGITNTKGLKGDWGKLWGTWLFEEKPKSLGTWDKEPIHGGPANGPSVDTVTITDPNYTADMANEQTQKDALARFMKEHPNPKPGDVLATDPADEQKFTFTGPGTKEGGNYNALEWFTGSYSTNIKCTGIDPATGKPQLQFTTTNLSHWESGTRVPAAGQAAGGGKYLVPDDQRGQGFGLGGNFQQKYVWTETAP